MPKTLKLTTPNQVTIVVCSCIKILQNWVVKLSNNDDGSLGMSHKESA